MINFMGKELSNPVIASSCIATENLKNILRLADNGVQGAILKSCADYRRVKTGGKREFAVDENGFTYASSPFEKEIITLDECISLMQKLRSETNILLIPSFTALTLDSEKWIAPCRKLAETGADGIQLDFFYMGCLIGQKDFSHNIVNFLKEIISAVDIPIMPKLNINLPKDFIIPLLADAGITYISLLDSVRSPYVANKDGQWEISDRLDPETTSCFGNWQLPLTISYTYTAVKYRMHVCAGGGITSADDVKKLLAVGAETVQSATFLTKYPEKVSYLL